MKKLALIRRSNDSHWVGDGFPVRSIFTYNGLAQELSPFLLMDYAGPANLSASQLKRGVGEPPHRGFETVTIVYEGEVEYRDSSGGGGKIGKGDVQWMTAASGIVHEEFHGTEYAKRGGTFEMIQLWVNLPKKHKLGPAGYQSISKEEIPIIELPKGEGLIRVIAREYSGDYKSVKGPARTFSPMNVWDLRLKAGSHIELQAPGGWTTSFFALKGRIRLNGGEVVSAAELAVFEREGDMLSLEAVKDATLLFLSGETLSEPIVGYGPFVMNTVAEIRQAFMDYQNGKMGHLT